MRFIEPVTLQQTHIIPREDNSSTIVLLVTSPYIAVNGYETLAIYDLRNGQLVDEAQISDISDLAWLNNGQTLLYTAGPTGFGAYTSSLIPAIPTPTPVPPTLTLTNTNTPTPTRTPTNTPTRRGKRDRRAL